MLLSFVGLSNYKLSTLPRNTLLLTCTLVRIPAIDPMFLSDIISLRITWDFTGHSEEHFTCTSSFISQALPPTPLPGMRLDAGFTDAPARNGDARPGEGGALMEEVIDDDDTA